LGLSLPQSSLLLATNPSQFNISLPANFLNLAGQFTPPSSNTVINVNYTGFTPQAQTAFQFAVDIWESLLDTSVPITVDASFSNLGANVLGSAGSNNFYRNFTGATQSNTWYPVALANSLAGTDLDTSSSDINAQFSNAFNWYYGTDGNVPYNQISFVSVVLHELGHGLGFLGLMQNQSGSGSWGYGSGFPGIYDRFTKNGSGQNLINTSLFPNPSNALGSQLTSNNIYFDGTNANAANGGNQVKLYAPSTWSSGSSYAHLDESFNNTPNALMTYSIGYGESILNPGPVTLGLFKDMGWKLLSSPTDLNLSNSTIAENQAIGTAIGTFTSTDPDTGNTFTYSLVTGIGSTDNALFAISGNQLQSNGIFDYETQNSYSIRVRTTDQGGLTFEKQLTIGVTNINETPTNLNLSNSTIAENQAIGTGIGTFTSTDPDTGNTFTYSLVTGIGSNDNALFAITGNQLQSNGIFDFETKNSYSIRVRTTDQGGLAFEKQLSIGITDVGATLVGVWDYLSYAYAVTVVGNYLYAVGDTLDIIDISDPAKPVFKGNYDISSGYDVQVVDNYAYVTDYGSGLQIIDISNPTSPTLKGNYSTYINGKRGVQVVGNYAYVADRYSGLQIIDISNPTSPTLKGNYYTFNASGVQVVGNYAYVADSDSGLQIIDISNPTSPTLKGNYDTSGSANGVQVAGNYAYVADGDSGLQIIDISNPTSPTLKGNYDTPYYALRVQVVGNYAYVADKHSGLQIININNPAAPTLVGNYDTTIAHGVQVVGNYAYVADDEDSLKIIDISNPTSPTLKGNYDTGYASGVQVVGNYAYVADWDSGLQIIDISNPTSPTLKGNYDTGYASGVQVVGNYAYVADSYGLQIIDISNPTSPTLKGNYDTSYAKGVQVVGNYAYVAYDGSGLQIIDISNPTSPTLKGNYDTSGNAYGVQVVGNYAYVADGDSGLQIIDISNPTSPTLKGNYDTIYAVGVQVVGNYAYLADIASGLQIIDISNPTSPTLKGNTSGQARGVQVVGNYAYVADNDQGLQIIDISNPTSPTLKGNYDTNGSAWGVQVVGNYAYVADYEGGLKIIDVSDFTLANQAPTNITLSTSNIAENQVIGTVVGNFSSTDPDSGNTFTYSLVSGTGSTDNASFFIINGNQLSINASPDYETKSSYNIRVRTTDQSGLSYEKQLTIGITDINETPTNLSLSNSNISENQAIGTAIGTLTSTDPDTGNTFTYSLIAGIGSTDNALFAITGNQLQSNAIFDYETKNSYSIRVRTTDQSGLSFEKQLTIEITDIDDIIVNSGVISFSDSQFSVNEDGTPVNQVTLTRTEGSTGEVSVTLNLTDNTATTGSDYDATPIIVTFADGETNKTVIIPLVDDLIFENDENFNVTLTNPTGGSALGNQTTATVTIIDGGNTKQYASSVIAFSSEWSSSSWSAEQVLGQPDTSIYGDISTSWAPRPRNADGDIDADEFITVGFSTPVYATAVALSMWDSKSLI
jgi:hypothetical protein